MPSKRIQIKVRLITRNLSLICQVIPIIFLIKRKINYYQKLKNTFVLAVVLGNIGCGNLNNTSEKKFPEPYYTGRETCKRCHEKEYQAYRGSHHDLAMSPATNDTVLGDFSGASFTHHNVTSKFYKKDGNFLVTIPGSHGKLQEFYIKYTFGFYPLQQYLVEFPGGRLQCLPLCWDSRPKSEGGQRWFHIYGKEYISPQDVLYWTSVSQNWNSMCAECHSTNLRKNFDYKSETYDTLWSEIDVSCEACHGPGSSHVDWAAASVKAEPSINRPNKGLTINLNNPAVWNWTQKTATATRTPPLNSNVQTEMCARCHSRRAVISENYIHGDPFLNTHSPSLLEEGLYYPDGQILDEVYVYGSYLQSKMYSAGVVCTDCHDPHSGEVYSQDDSLCGRCHQLENYSSPTHHYHPSQSKGARCVECHMPETTYMIVDPRRDHSFRIPRPDLTKALNTPNACNKCHTQQTPDWAADQIEKWHGPQNRKKHFGEIFSRAQKNFPGQEALLIGLVQSLNESTIVRATAASLLKNYPTQTSLKALTQIIREPHPLIRAAATTSMEILLPKDQFSILLPLLKDPVRVIRTLTGRALASVPSNQLTKSDQQWRRFSLKEYEQIQFINGDQPSSHLNLGNLYRELNRMRKSENSYRKALQLEPSFIPAYLNLVDLYREEAQDIRGKEILLEALQIVPHSGIIHHALGLLLVRTNDHSNALIHLEKALELNPDISRHGYVFGVALNSIGNSSKAIDVLENALEDHPYDRNLLFALATIQRDQGHFKKALNLAVQLVQNNPGISRYLQLKHQLELLVP